VWNGKNGESSMLASKDPGSGGRNGQRKMRHKHTLTVKYSTLCVGGDSQLIHTETQRTETHGQTEIGFVSVFVFVLCFFVCLCVSVCVCVEENLAQPHTHTQHTHIHRSDDESL
jgi:hypothetical protein